MMACDERGHRALEQALTKMREERNEQTDRARSLHGNVVGLEAKIRSLEVTLHDAKSRAEQAELRLAELEKKPVPVLVTHTSDCRGCGGTYICPRCGHVFGYCVGAWDDTPALCDDCANVVQFDEDS